MMQMTKVDIPQRALMSQQALRLYNEAAEAFNSYHKAASAHNQLLAGDPPTQPVKLPVEATLNVPVCLPVAQPLVADLKTAAQAQHKKLQATNNAMKSVVTPEVDAEWVEEKHLQNIVDPGLLDIFRSIDSQLIKTKTGDNAHSVKLKDLRSWVRTNWVAFSPSIAASSTILRALTQRLIGAQMGKEVVHRTLQEALTRAHSLAAQQFDHAVPHHVVETSIELQNVLHNFMRRMLQQRRGVAPGAKAPSTRPPPVGFGQFARVSTKFSEFVVRLLSKLDGVDPALWNPGVFHSRATAGRVVSLYAHMKKLHNDGAITIDDELAALFGVESGTRVRTNQMQKFITAHIGKQVADQDTACAGTPPPGKDEWWSTIEAVVAHIGPPTKRQKVAATATKSHDPSAKHQTSVAS